MPIINPYLNFQGNAEEAFLFYQSVFGGEFIGGISRYKNMPDSDKMSPEDQEKIMHIGLPIGKNNVIMGTDSLESQGQVLKMGNNHFLSISTESKEEADRIFAGLSAGGQVTMPLENTFWGAYFGMFNDKFGIQWMVNYDAPK